jgi:hypothetical protein
MNDKKKPDPIDTLSNSLARIINATDDPDIQMIALDAQAKVAELRAKRYREEVYRRANKAAEVAP